MSLTLSERNRLATPVELSAAPPPTFAAPAIEGIEIVPHDGTPDYVISARRLVEKHPKSPAALAQLAQAEQSIGERELAVAAAQRSVALIGKKGDDPVVFAALQVLLACGRNDLAANALPSIENSEIRNLLQARISIEERELGDAARLLEGLTSPDALATQGWIHLELGQYERAIRLLRQAMATGGATPPVLMNLGYAHAAVGSRVKAIRLTKQATVLAPENEAIGFNLVSFHAAEGDIEAARQELRRLREIHPRSLRFDLAEADLYLRNREPRLAYETLRRARQSARWAYADRIELSELEANLAFLEWRRGSQGRKAAADIVVAQLERTEFSSIEIARLVPALLYRITDAEVVERVYQELADVHGREELAFLEVHLALVESRFEDAAQAALAWAKQDIFSSHAASVAIYLLGAVSADFERAVELGARALRVAGPTDELLNNLAYVHALRGDLQRARELISRGSRGEVFLTATEGLVEILAGNTSRGLELYEAAYDLAVAEAADEELPVMVKMNQALALHRAGVQVFHPTPPVGWLQRPYWLLFKRASERAGVEWAADEEAGARA